MEKTRTKKQEIAHRKEWIRVIESQIGQWESELVRIEKEIERLKELGSVQSMILDKLLSED